MKEYFKENSYDSPDNVKNRWTEYVFLRSRWSPYISFFGVMFHSRSLAIKGLYDDEAWMESSMEVLRRLEGCGAKFHIRGLDNIRELKEPVVFIANHMSTMETTQLPGMISPYMRCTYIVKEKLMHGPVWGPIMRSRDPIAVTRKDARKDLETVLTEGQKRLANGVSVIVFPQGTRTDVFNREEFNSLGIKLASRAGVKIVPVALRTDYWGNSKIFRGFGPVRRKSPVWFEFGKAISIEGKGKAEHQACLDFIESRLIEWGAQVLKA